VCPKLAALFKRGPFEWKFNLQIVELYMLALLDVAAPLSAGRDDDGKIELETLSDVDDVHNRERERHRVFRGVDPP
jgi:hypothetical protein